ncbi:unnamed protein product [Closterium sp. NIES-53]
MKATPVAHHQQQQPTAVAHHQKQPPAAAERDAAVAAAVPQLKFVNSPEKMGNSQQELAARRGFEEVVARVVGSDGHNWLKYGQKQVQRSNATRCYYKCSRAKTNLRCPAKKTVDINCRNGLDPLSPGAIQVSYRCRLHNHPAPPNHASAAATAAATATITAAAAASHPVFPAPAASATPPAAIAPAVAPALAGRNSAEMMPFSRKIPVPLSFEVTLESTQKSSRELPVPLSFNERHFKSEQTHNKQQQQQQQPEAEWAGMWDPIAWPGTSPGMDAHVQEGLAGMCHSLASPSTIQGTEKHTEDYESVCLARVRPNSLESSLGSPLVFPLDLPLDSLLDSPRDSPLDSPRDSPLDSPLGSPLESLGNMLSAFGSHGVGAEGSARLTLDEMDEMDEMDEIDEFLCERRVVTVDVTSSGCNTGVAARSKRLLGVVAASDVNPDVNFDFNLDGNLDGTEYDFHTGGMCGALDGAVMHAAGLHAASLHAAGLHASGMHREIDGDTMHGAGMPAWHEVGGSALLAATSSVIRSADVLSQQQQKHDRQQQKHRQQERHTQPQQVQQEGEQQRRQAQQEQLPTQQPQMLYLEQQRRQPQQEQLALMLQGEQQLNLILLALSNSLPRGACSTRAKRPASAMAAPAAPPLSSTPASPPCTHHALAAATEAHQTSAMAAPAALAVPSTPASQHSSHHSEARENAAMAAPSALPAICTPAPRPCTHHTLSPAHDACQTSAMATPAALPALHAPASRPCTHHARLNSAFHAPASQTCMRHTRDAASEAFLPPLDLSTVDCGANGGVMQQGERGWDAAGGVMEQTWSGVEGPGTPTRSSSIGERNRVDGRVSQRMAACSSSIGERNSRLVARAIKNHVTARSGSGSGSSISNTGGHGRTSETAGGGLTCNIQFPSGAPLLPLAAVAASSKRQQPMAPHESCGGELRTCGHDLKACGGKVRACAGKMRACGVMLDAQQHCGSHCGDTRLNGLPDSLYEAPSGHHDAFALSVQQGLIRPSEQQGFSSPLLQQEMFGPMIPEAVFAFLGGANTTRVSDFAAVGVRKELQSWLEGGSYLKTEKSGLCFGNLT